jgi:motility quorum-sensing regulator/GCU-specific mRNA interferase toxin
MDSRTKRRASYDLNEIQVQMTSVCSMNLTRSAIRGIRAAGLCEEDALAVVAQLTSRNFYKSMPCEHDHRIWQDVYLATWRGIDLYVKFQKSGEFFVISFKESDAYEW